MKAYFLKQTQEISIQVGKNVEDTLNEKFKILRITAKYIDEKDLSNLKETAESFSETIEKEGFRKMAISTLDGKSYASNGEIYDVSEREYFKKAKQGKENVSNVVNSLDDYSQVNIFAVQYIIYKEQ